MTRAYLGLGSNMNDREQMLQRAMAELAASPGVTLLRSSSLYETEPVGPLPQDWFLNAVLEVDTSLVPIELLALCKQIERALGRTPGARWGPRPIDIDILWFNGIQLTTEGLVIPHPQLGQRAFVLVPLVELCPDLQVPGGLTAKQLLLRLGDPHEVRPYAGNGARQSFKGA